MMYRDATKSYVVVDSTGAEHTYEGLDITDVVGQHNEACQSEGAVGESAVAVFLADCAELWDPPRWLRELQK